MTVLVTGATGTVGSAVVEELRGRGIALRAFVGEPARAADRLGAGVEIAVGDFDDPESIRGALDGVDRLFLSSADGPRKVQHEAAVVDAAAAGGVGATVFAQAGAPLAPFDWNCRSEDQLWRSGVPAAVPRSHFYTTNLLAAAQQIRGGRPLFAPAGQDRAARQALEASGMPAWLIEHLVGVFARIRSGAFAETTTWCAR